MTRGRLGPVLILILFITIVLISGRCYGQQVGQRNQRQLVLPDGEIAQVAVLTTIEQQRLGFSHQRQPSSDSGLLFLWTTSIRPVMVMRDMLFSLDIIWLNDKKIVQLTSNTQPEGHQPITKYQPVQSVDAVIEMPAGFIGRHSLQIGQSIDWR